MADRFRPPREIHARQFDDETVILDLTAGKYFALNKIGSIVWRHLSVGGAVDAIVADLLSNFEVDETTARADVNRITDELLAAGLLEREQ